MKEYQEEEKKESTQEDATPEWEAKLCVHVMREWDLGQTYCSQLNDLYDDLYAMIRGERPQKNYDWQSNIVINKVFQIVWTAIPYITQKIFGASPVINVQSFDKKGAWQREAILEFWNNLHATVDKQHVPFFLVTVMWLLRSLLNGVGILKKGWHQKLETSTVEVDVPESMNEDGTTANSKYKKTFKFGNSPKTIRIRENVGGLNTTPRYNEHIGMFLTNLSINLDMSGTVRGGADFIGKTTDELGVWAESEKANVLVIVLYYSFEMINLSIKTFSLLSPTLHKSKSCDRSRHPCN